jgi:hypothetical protein
METSHMLRTSVEILCPRNVISGARKTHFVEVPTSLPPGWRMLNFYRWFLPQAATHQAPLNDILSGPNTKGTKPITWTSELKEAFDQCKLSLSRVTLLAHSCPTSQLALVTDASTTSTGAVLQQRLTGGFHGRLPQALSEKHCITSGSRTEP